MSKTGLFTVVDSFVDRGVELVIIGGHAVNFHGHIRATEDVDIVFQRTTASEKTLCDVLVEHQGFRIGDEIDTNTGLEKTHPVSLDSVRSNHLLMVGTQVGYLDIFDFIPGMPSH